MSKENFYNIELPELDLTKPIGCEFKSTGVVSILIPHINPDADDYYKVTGYDWFDFSSGQYSSAANYESVEKAIRSRKGYEASYVLYNIEVITKKV